MAYFIRARATSYELRVKHKLLPRPFYATFPTHAAAQTYADQLEAMLAAGVLPAELQTAAPAAPDPPLMQIVRAYIAQAPHLTSSDDALLASMLTELADTRLSAISYRWAADYVRGLKRRTLAPGTIRKRVGVLARVLDWHLASSAAAGVTVPGNPLRLLPTGYSQYTQAEREALALQGDRAPTDVQRDRRLHPAEETAIRAALAGAKRPDRERPWAPGGDPALELLFDVVLWTGLRLREAYRLRADQVDVQRWVLRVEGSKGARGLPRPRVVPVPLPLREPLRAWCAGRVGLLWPYWDGTPEGLQPATARLSARFRSLFAYAGAKDLTEHDLRHEATCRWFELRDPAGRWLFADVEVARIMGWTNLAMALRYASLRGEDLAARLTAL